MADPVLTATEIVVRFGGLTALDEVSLMAGTGEIVGIIGPNGAGKTTLFNVMCGFVRPTSGQLAVDGRPLRRVHPHQLARMGIARTLQGVNLWHGLTVLENVMASARDARRAGFVSAFLGLPRSAAAEQRARESALATLRELDIADAADRLPGSLPYPLQKRASIARALVTRPRLLLLDEPASGLSDAEMTELGELMRGLRQRMGIVLVEHHMDLVMAVCDRLVVLDFGAVIASGTPAQVRDDPAVTAAYLGRAITDDHGPGPDHAVAAETPASDAGGEPR